MDQIRLGRAKNRPTYRNSLVWLLLGCVMSDDSYIWGHSVTCRLVQFRVMPELRMY